MKHQIKHSETSGGITIEIINEQYLQQENSAWFWQILFAMILQKNYKKNPFINFSFQVSSRIGKTKLRKSITVTRLLISSSIFF